MARKRDVIIKYYRADGTLVQLKWLCDSYQSCEDQVEHRSGNVWQIAAITTMVCPLDQETFSSHRHNILILKG